MTSIYMLGTIVVGGTNVLLASALLVVYRGVYARTKAAFSLALLVFAVAFLAHNLLTVYSLLTMMSLVPRDLDPFLLGISVFEAVGLGAMLWTATR